MKKLIVSLLLISSSAFAWDNICDLAKETPYMTSVKLNEFFKKEMEDRLFDGKGFVRDVRAFGSGWVVVVDCGNDVLVNVVTSSSSVKDLKTGQEVNFSGRCKYSFRRFYRDTKRTYQLFELQDGVLSQK